MTALVTKHHFPSPLYLRSQSEAVRALFYTAKYCEATAKGNQRDMQQYGKRAGYAGASCMMFRLVDEKVKRLTWRAYCLEME